MKLLSRVETPPVGKTLYQAADFAFWCPGCKCAHGVWVSGPTAWTFNGNMEKPTFTPSLRISGSTFSEKGKADYQAWKDAGYPHREAKAFDSVASCCHVVITDGILNFCADSTHELAGKSVPMEDMDS